MYRRLILPAMVGLIAAFGSPGAQLAMNHPAIVQEAPLSIRRRSMVPFRFGRSAKPRYHKKHERQRVPHKNCRHRKPARARRRAARLRGRKG